MKFRECHFNYSILFGLIENLASLALISLFLTGCSSTENEKIVETAELKPTHYTLRLGEVQENKEQIEISKFYESLPKPVAIAIQEYIEGKVYVRDTRVVAEEEK